MPGILPARHHTDVVALIGKPDVNETARETPAAPVGRHDQGRQFARAIAVWADLRRADDGAALVRRDDEIAPIEMIRVEAFGADQRHDRRLIAGRCLSDVWACA